MDKMPTAEEWAQAVADMRRIQGELAALVRRFAPPPDGPCHYEKHINLPCPTCTAQQ